MAIVFTASINSTSKTVTITVTNNDSHTSADIYCQVPGGSSYDLVSSALDVTVVPVSKSLYYSSGIVDTGAEDTVFPDGVYHFKVVNNGDTPGDSDTDVMIFTDAVAKCCLASKIAAIIDYDCNDCARTVKMNDLFFMKLLLEGAEHDGTTSCSDYTEAQSKLDYVTDYCDDDGNCYKSGCS